jgi:cell filamentation protein
MDDHTAYALYPMDENKLGLTDREEINAAEMRGIAEAEFYAYAELDLNTELSATLILHIHRLAFKHLYDWAGKWRNTQVVVGALLPPDVPQVVFLMYQFLEQLNYKITQVKTVEDVLDCLAYAHHQFIYIHPFNNGNGRTGRILMNIVALKYGYAPIQLYHRKGDRRKVYIDAMKTADKGNYQSLKDLIQKELKAL